MKKLLVISLYDGDNEVSNFDQEEFLEIQESCTKNVSGDKTIWMGEEQMFVEL
jgi:hypothetical protein